MNVYNHPRGTICVERSSNGRVEWLALGSQWAYKEWPGCFTVL